MQIEVSAFGVTLARHTLAGDRPLLGVDAQGNLIVDGADGRKARLWIAKRGALVCAMSVDVRFPATIDGQSLGTTWAPLAGPCAIKLGRFVVNVGAKPTSNDDDDEMATRIARPLPIQRLDSTPPSGVTRVAALTPPSGSHLMPEDATRVRAATPSNGTRVPSAARVPALNSLAATRVGAPLRVSEHTRVQPAAQPTPRKVAVPAPEPPRPLPVAVSSSSSSIPAVVQSNPPPPPAPAASSSRGRGLRLAGLGLVAALLGLWLIGMNSRTITASLRPTSSQATTAKRAAAATAPAETASTTAAAPAPTPTTTTTTAATPAPSAAPTVAATPKDPHDAKTKDAREPKTKDARDSKTKTAAAAADAGAPAFTPDENGDFPQATPEADRKIAEAMFAGDYQRAIDESSQADATSMRYAVISRVLRAKAARVAARGR